MEAIPNPCHTPYLIGGWSRFDQDAHCQTQIRNGIAILKQFGPKNHKPAIGIHTNATPIICSLISPDLVTMASSGAKIVAATNEIIMGGYLFSSINKTQIEINEIE